MRFGVIMGRVWVFGLDLLLVISVFVCCSVMWVVAARAEIVEKIEVKPVEVGSTLVVSGLNFTNTIRVPVLMYHHVGDLPIKTDKIRTGLTVSTEDFVKQVSLLKREGFESVTLEQIRLAMAGEFELPEKSVAFTFDDGYSDVFENALPVLRQNGYLGSIGVITDLVGQEGYASWDEIESFGKVGFEMVSHTAAHFDGANAKYTRVDIARDITKSLDELENHLGVRSRVLIYPFGHFSESYISILDELGIDIAFTVKYGLELKPESRLQLPRVRVSRGMSEENFLLALKGELGR